VTSVSNASTHICFGGEKKEERKEKKRKEKKNIKSASSEP
jgi:hypothetical protein